MGPGGRGTSDDLVNNHEGRDVGMKRSFIVSIALATLVGSAVGASAAEGEAFTGAGNGADGAIVDGATPAEPRPDRRKYESYDYTEAGKSVRLTLPEGLAVVRGILVVGPYAGADSRARRAVEDCCGRGRCSGL